jgi:hypothetical protein
VGRDAGLRGAVKGKMNSLKTRQVSVFVSNRVGRLASVARCLRDAAISIRAMSLADAPDFGIFRLIVEDSDRAVRALKSNGFVVDLHDVVAVEIPDRPGGLAVVLDQLATSSLNVEYMYAFLTQSAPGGKGRALVFFRFEDTDAALAALLASGVSVVGGEALWSAAGRGDEVER